jgi:predicted nucleotidyltransferase
MVTQLVRALAPERIYLFGSRARGDATEESDYDLLVVVGGEAGAHPHHALARLAYHALAGVGVPKDIVVMTRGRFEWLRGAAASLPATVVREGRLLYVA